jgi:hypothetical protein
MSVKIYVTRKQHGQHLVVAQGKVYGARHPAKIMVAELNIAF